jgi:NAD(P)-dependent dehydrogenase (short-subunit alcohol dehydrogenase family)
VSHWSEDDIPDQTGRTAVVTGGTGGLGLRTAIVLAEHGARVLLTSRNAQRGAAALEQVQRAATGADPEIVQLELGDLQSVKDAARDIRERTGDRLDLLINNAGIMAPPLGFSEDGFESQWATNVLGPAALTWLTAPAVEHVEGARVVFVSSLAHFGGSFTANRIERDLRGDGYVAFGVYGRTKLADLLLSRELERSFRRRGSSAISVAAHPGMSATGLIESTTKGKPEWVKTVLRSSISLAGQSAEDGALPSLYAATEPAVRGSQYFGPAWVFETRGPPTRAARTPASRSDELGAILLDEIERTTGVSRF